MPIAKTYKMCQSCGMPMRYDPNGGGTESNGTKSVMYCSYCYTDGEFIGNFKTAKEMQTFCVVKMVEMRFPKFLAWLFTRSIPKLERWKTE